MAIRIKIVFSKKPREETKEITETMTEPIEVIEPEPTKVKKARKPRSKKAK